MMLRQSLAPRRQSTNLRKISNEEPVKVAIRIRPLPSNSSNENLTRAFRAGSNSVIEDSKKEYNYDNVFGEEADTTQIYSEFVKDIVSSVSNDGLNGTIFTYGQTSSGKTFTMQGIHETEGLIQYAVRDIFKTIEQQMNANSESAVKVSYVEVYNEELRDLLSDKRKSNPSSLEIQEDDRKGTIMVKNLEVVAVQSAEQLMQEFRAGEANRSMGSTKMNDRSSRSHAILQITVEKKTKFNALSEDCSDEKENNELASPKKNSFVVKTSSTLNLVDLAGSESVRLTGATGQQKKEGGMINESLLSLSKVLMSLGDKTPGHVNYRDSKLTRILKPSLSGNARMAAVCCISPSESYIDETRYTLQFATRAKLVTTNARTNEVIESNVDDAIIRKLQLDLEKARSNNERLVETIQHLQAAHNDTKQSLKAGNTNIERLNSQIMELTSKNNDLTTKNAALQKKHDEVLAVIKAVFEDMAEVQSEHNLLPHEPSTFASAKSEAESLPSQLEVTKAELIKVTKMNADLSSKNETLKSQLSNAENQGKAMNAKMTDLEKSLNEARSEQNAARNERNAARSQRDEARSERNEARKMLCDFQVESDERLERLNKALSEGKSKANSLETQLESLRAENKTVSDKLSTAKSDAELLSSQLEVTKAELVNVTKMYADLSSTNETLKPQLSDATKQAGQSQKKRKRDSPYFDNFPLQPRDDGPPSVTLLVRNVSPDVTIQELRRAFGRKGTVRHVYIPRDIHSRKPKRFAFIEYATLEEARDARDEMNGFVIKGIALQVVYARWQAKKSFCIFTGEDWFLHGRTIFYCR